MLVYLDNSFLNRPFDDPEAGVNKLEAEVIDALHLASAEKAQVDLFITCEYNLIKKYKGDMKIITPLDFFNHYGYTKD